MEVRDGNYYCLLEDGSVSYWSHDGTSNEVWPSLASWIKQAWIEGE
nr:SMI1/KNR4 family protein [Pseudomonas fluorescens]